MRKSDQCLSVNLPRVSHVLVNISFFFSTAVEAILWPMFSTVWDRTSQGMHVIKQY